MLQILLLMCGFVPNCGLRVGDLNAESGSLWQGMHGTFMNAHNLARDIQSRPEWFETLGDVKKSADFEKFMHPGNAMKHLGGRTFGTRMRDGFFADDEGTPSLLMSTLANLSTTITMVLSDPILKRHAPSIDVEQWKKNSAYFSDQNAPAMAKLVNEQGRLLTKSKEASPFLDRDIMDAAMNPPWKMPDWDMLDPSKYLPGLLQEEEGRPKIPELGIGWPRISVFGVHKFVVGKEWGVENFDFFQYGVKSLFLKFNIDKMKPDGWDFLKPKGYAGFTYGWSWGKFGMKFDLCPLIGVAVRLTFKINPSGEDKSAASYNKWSVGGCLEGTWRFDNFLGKLGGVDFRMRYCGGVVWKVMDSTEQGLWVVYLVRGATLNGPLAYETEWPKTFDLNFIFATDIPVIPGTLRGIAPQYRQTLADYRSLGRLPFGQGPEGKGVYNPLLLCAAFWKPDPPPESALPADIVTD